MKKHNIEIIENSDIVNWNEYPEYICAIVLETNTEFETDSGGVIQSGHKFMHLLDKSPSINGDEVTIKNANVNCLGGIGFLNGSYDVTVKEIHYKPKPKQSLNKGELADILATCYGT